MKPDRKPAKPQPQPKAPKKPERPMVALKKKNYLIMAAGVAVIAIGFISLSGGSITLAPILLLLGYCVVIPVGLLLK